MKRTPNKQDFLNIFEKTENFSKFLETFFPQILQFPETHPIHKTLQTLHKFLLNHKHPILEKTIYPKILYNSLRKQLRKELETLKIQNIHPPIQLELTDQHCEDFSRLIYGIYNKYVNNTL